MKVLKIYFYSQARVKQSVVHSKKHKTENGNFHVPLPVPIALTRSIFPCCKMRVLELKGVGASLHNNSSESL